MLKLLHSRDSLLTTNFNTTIQKRASSNGCLFYYAVISSTPIASNMDIFPPATNSSTSNASSMDIIPSAEDSPQREERKKRVNHFTLSLTPSRNCFMAPLSLAATISFSSLSLSIIPCSCPFVLGLKRISVSR